ncbi:hypothetical protein M408DRAFT_165381 [Serendipita vermifera MAFF 305830]|uniref:Nicotinate phosphoribosyltransferase n=1 Tax=Serendipita vermifera MAFF 305830 TaxID=933852 RepID=A0A0C3B5L7_SERVB|nr:hypothetical protein M408DRAFT_165381 [Serendipita vermifera MAFF 305830]
MAEIHSILDTDLYKLTMQQAIMRCFPEAVAKYRFTNRSHNMEFNQECVEELRESLKKLRSVNLTQEEHDWLQETCPYLDEDYLAYLRQYRFKPEQVDIVFVPSEADPARGQIEMTATGPWLETILWEVPLMAVLSENYFLFVDKTWRRDDQEENAYQKGKRLLESGCDFSEFGTRRRRSFEVQDEVVRGLIRADREKSSTPGAGKLFGTSNVHLAHKYGLKPIGTIAHEWFMAIAAIHGYTGCSIKALSLWESVYSTEKGRDLWISLTDTFSSDVFFKELRQNPEYAKRWRLRQDSGDPLEYVQRVAKLYEELGVDKKKNPIVFSDSLNVEKAIKIKAVCDQAGLSASFGIGTFLSNDFVKADGSGPSKALDMVIKLASINGVPCVKISDEITKNTGLPSAVEHVKEIFGIPSG